MEEEEEDVKKEKKRPEELTCPEWMMTMGDTMSLLLCFFVLLLTFSTMEEAKLMNILGVLQGANAPNRVAVAYEPSRFRDVEGTRGKEGTLRGIGVEERTRIAAENLSSVILNDAEIIKRFNEIKRDLANLGFENIISLEEIEQGLSISINADDLFERSSVKTLKHAYLLLQGFANMAGNVGSEVRILSCFSPRNGNRPGNRLTNEWGLALKRTHAIGDLLANQFEIDSNRFGFGVQIIPSDQADYMQLILLEKIGVKEVSLDELLSMKLVD